MRMARALISIPFFIAWSLKIAYDLLLFRALWATRPPEEVRRVVVVVWILIFGASAASAQDRPSLRVGRLPADIAIDGRLTELAWESAEAIEDFRQTDPAEGAAPTERTRVKVLADERAIVIGIIC